MPSLLDAKAILRSLVVNNVEFVLVDGLAMTGGSADVTDDLEICYNRSPDNVERLAAAVAPFRPYLRGVPEGLPFRFDAATITAGLNFTLTTEGGPLVVLGEISGVGDYSHVRKESDVQEMFGLLVATLTLDGLIAAKKAAARSKTGSI